MMVEETVNVLGTLMVHEKETVTKIPPHGLTKLLIQKSGYVIVVRSLTERLQACDELVSMGSIQDCCKVQGTQFSDN